MATQITKVAEEAIPENQPIEIQDEYALALQSDVLDDTLLEPPEDAKFAITTYGVDYTVDTIIARVNSEDFFVPQFQRRFVWSQRHASRFIESLLMGLPVPGIFLYRDADFRHMVVDGQQRLRTLQYFYSGTFGEKVFRLIGVAKEWSNLTYKELTPADRLRLRDAVVHATVFQQDEPKDSLRSLQHPLQRDRGVDDDRHLELRSSRMRSAEPPRILPAVRARRRPARLRNSLRPRPRASSRIRRCSASALRPLAAARSLSARTRASGTSRIRSCAIGEQYHISHAKRPPAGRQWGCRGK